MRYLLDTHAFLWWVDDDSRLSGSARTVISAPENELFLSVASAWEMAVKVQLGRLAITPGLETFLSEHVRRNALRVLPIVLTHTMRLHALPLHHRDPFDRILIAQALSEDLTLITADREIGRYDVPITW